MQRLSPTSLAVVIALLATTVNPGCTSFTSQECGDWYVHVDFVGGLSSFRLVALTSSPRLDLNIHGTNHISNWTAWKDSSVPKVTFENENPIAVICENPIVFITDSMPTSNSVDNARIRIVQPYELIDLDTLKYDIIIR